MTQVGTRVDARKRQQNLTWSVEVPSGGRRTTSRSRSPDSKVAKEKRAGDLAVASGGGSSAMHVDAAVAAGA